jgi:hypothetical protein
MEIYDDTILTKKQSEEKEKSENELYNLIYEVETKLKEVSKGDRG